MESHKISVSQHPSSGSFSAESCATKRGGNQTKDNKTHDPGNGNSTQQTNERHPQKMIKGDPR